jgi:hypothetical protein
MSQRYTIALRVCVSCRRQFGVGIWPWSGSAWMRTHGFCRRCTPQLDPRPPSEHTAPTASPPPA